jgi:hypothetical protein
MHSVYLNGFVSYMTGIAVIYLFGLGYIPFGSWAFGSDLAVWSVILPTLPLMLVGDAIKAFVLIWVLPILVREMKTIRGNE